MKNQCPLCNTKLSLRINIPLTGEGSLFHRTVVLDEDLKIINNPTIGVEDLKCERNVFCISCSTYDDDSHHLFRYRDQIKKINPGSLR